MSLKDARTKIERQFGKGSLMRCGDSPYVPAICVSTGILSLDRAIRPNPLGGFPRGRIIEIFGQEATGKTSIALSAAAEAQKLGENCALIDAECGFDRAHAQKLGVAVDDLLISQPSCGEEGLEICDYLVQSNDVGVIIVDSVSALVPRAELEGSMGDPTMALQARLMNSALRKLTGSVAKTNTCLIFINQLRDKIGTFYGSPTVTTGGKGLKFYSSLRLSVSRIGNLKDGEQVVGGRTKVKIEKNKIAAPASVCEFDFYYATGFSKEGDVLDLCVENGLAEKSGAWYSLNGERLGQGRDQAVARLREDKDLAGKLENAIREKLSK